MAKLTKDKITISISLSKEVVEVLNVFKNRSKLIDDLLSYFLLNLSPAEMLELIKTMTNGEDVVEFLVKKKCREFDKSEQKYIKSKQEKKEPEKEAEKEKKPNVNIKDWWG